MKILVDKETTAKALNIAMAVETGSADLDYILCHLGNAPDDVLDAIISFWNDFNDMTRNALDILTKCAQRNIDIDFLEKCYKL